MTETNKKLAAPRYFAGSFMLLIGVLGFYLEGLWVWLGTAGFILLVLLDVGLPRDEKLHPVVSGGLQHIVLYFQFPLIVTLWLMFANLLSLLVKGLSPLPPWSVSGDPLTISPAPPQNSVEFLSNPEEFSRNS